MSEKKKNYIAYAVFALLLCWIGVLCFYKLGVKYVDPWDEARHGVNAYEMLQRGNLFQNTYLYQTDLYNLKPPFSMWCLMVSFALLGAGTFSLRFYSGVCYLILAVVCGRFVWKRYGKLASFLTLGLLAANTTPFAAHMVRAGDADSLYVLFFTLAMLFMLKVSEKQSNLYWCGLFFALAFLTKSYHAFLIVAIGGLFLLVTGELKKMKPKTWLFFFLSFVIPILVWALPRFAVDGITFFKEMILTDVLGRADGTLQNNIQPFSWYAQYFLGAMSGKLTIYLWLFVIIVAGSFAFPGIFSKENWKEHRAEILGFGMWILIPSLAFSVVSNKLLWYLYPVTIPLILCGAIVLAKLIEKKELPVLLRSLASVIAIVLIVVFSKDVFKTIQTQTTVAGNEFQNLVSQLAKENQHAAAYVVYGMDETGTLDQEWAQQDVFVAEAFGNLLCRQGGYTAALKEAEESADSEQILIFVAKSCEVMMVEAAPEAEGVAETENYIVYALQ